MLDEDLFKYCLSQGAEQIILQMTPLLMYHNIDTKKKSLYSHI